MTDSKWQRAGSTAVKNGPWTVAKVQVGGTWSYEVWHQDHPLPLQRCGSFVQAKKFIAEKEAQ